MSEQSVREMVADLFVDFAGPNRPIVIQQPYLRMCDGDHVKALFLSQLAYWSNNGKSFCSSYEEWNKELCLTEKQVRRCAKEFQEEGFLEVRLAKEKGAPTLHYRLVKERLAEWILTKGQNRICPKGGIDPDQRAESYTESVFQNPYADDLNSTPPTPLRKKPSKTATDPRSRSTTRP